MVRAPLRKVFRPDRAVGWAVSAAIVPYPEAVAAMEARAAAIRKGQAGELVWLLEHPPLYTAGTSARPEELLDKAAIPVFTSGRGGQHTYHGPGQRVAYVMLDLSDRGRDVRAYVGALEEWIIAALARFDVRGERRDGRIGVWVDRSESGGQKREDKIAAIGVRIRRWVSFHGVALNVEPDLARFGGIVPCGINEPGLGVTSLSDLGRTVTLLQADQALRDAFELLFGRTVDAAPLA
ncbi:MAG: lipoyl(octanoyl) transferase LipB [Parvularculaceae bacterium]